MTKSLLSPIQLIAISFFSFSLQFATTIQIACTSSLYNFLGAGNFILPYLWLCGPIAGLITQLFIGKISDATTTPFGKRIPYLAICSFLMGLCLFFMPLLESITAMTIFLSLFFFTNNGCLIILRALISDSTPHTHLSYIYALQTAFSEFGAGMASIFPWAINKFPSYKLSTHHAIPISIKILFAIGAILAIISAWIIIKFKEKIRHGSLYKIKFNLLPFIKEIWAMVISPPPVIREFIFIQFFTWSGLFCMWVYLPLSMAENFYGLPSNINSINKVHYNLLLNSGTTLAEFFYGFYQLFSMVYASFIPKLIRKLKKEKLIYGFSLAAGSIGLMSTVLSKNVIILIIAIVGVGILSGAIMVIPPILITKAAPPEKMGLYHGVFNVTTTMPQIISGLILGPITIHLFHNHATNAIMFGSILIGISAIITLYQVYKTKN